jgi:hypothetical protein
MPHMNTHAGVNLLQVSQLLILVSCKSTLIMPNYLLAVIPPHIMLWLGWTLVTPLKRPVNLTT